MRNRSTRVVAELALRDPRVLALSGDSRNEDFEYIKKMRPGQSIDYGIAEANLIASAAGLASCGKIPFIYNISNFLSMRAFEFIRNDLCPGRLNVKMLGRSAGLSSYSLGLTHQGTEELALLRSLPELLTITPASPLEAEMATRAAYEHDGPVFIRLESTQETEIYGPDYLFQPGRGVLVRPGSDATVICMGSIVNEALAAAEELQNLHGLQLRVVNIHTVKPLDSGIILSAARQTGRIITLEEHSLFGGLGSAVAEALALGGAAGVKFKMMGLAGFCLRCGQRTDLRDYYGLSSRRLTSVVLEMAEAVK